tara:strand:+ start:1505 stop:2371 length:867 start_codon:yes stop_codon:yes gene_type:complete
MGYTRKRSNKRRPKKKKIPSKTKKKKISKKRNLDIERSTLMRGALGYMKRLQKEHKIVDIPFSESQSKGTAATLGDIHFHYQNYSNVMDYFHKIDHPSVCFFEGGKAFLNLRIEDIKMGIYPLEHNETSFKNNLMKCMKSKNRFIPVILNLITNEGNHANILLIDKKDKVVELYEPHGSRPVQSVLGGIKGAYNKKIGEVRRFWRRILPKYKVVNVVDFKRGTHFQMEYDPDNHSGFCVTWSILFVHYRLLNPHVKLENLVKYIAARVTTTKLLQYAKYVEDNIKNKI